MAFTKLINVKDEFRKLFSGASIVYKGDTLDIPVRYAVKSAFDYTEEQQQQVYPVISIYDRGITESEKFNRIGYTYIANQRGVGTDNPTGTIYYEPILLNFSFDVGIAAKSMLQHTELEEYIFKNFVVDNAKLLNKVTIDGYDFGEPVLLKTIAQKIPREDGVHETNFEITFDAWVQPKDPEDINLIKQLNISLEPISYFE